VEERRWEQDWSGGHRHPSLVCPVQFFHLAGEDFQLSCISFFHELFDLQCCEVRTRHPPQHPSPPSMARSPIKVRILRTLSDLSLPPQTPTPAGPSQRANVRIPTSPPSLPASNPIPSDSYYSPESAALHASNCKPWTLDWTRAFFSLSSVLVMFI
jgi:hypothetical protein